MSGVEEKSNLLKKIHEKIGKNPGCNFDQGKSILVLIIVILELNCCANPKT